MEPGERDSDYGEPETVGDGVRPQAPVSAAGPTPVPPVAAKISRRRLVGVDALIGVTTLLLVIGIFAIWANRLLFSPTNWSNASGQLLENPNIRATTADYLVEQLYANVNVASLLKSGLPTQLQPLAAPAAGALRNAAVSGVELALTRPRVQSLWMQANRAADQTFIAVVKGGKGPVGVKQGVVTLDLSSILDNIAQQLGLPSGLAAKLPANIANLTIFKSDQLKFVQNAGNAIQGLALWLTILVPVLYALALLLAKDHRRRTLMTIGFAGVFAGVLVLLGRSILESQIPNSITNDDALRPTVKATIAISTYILSDVAGACVFIGILLVAAAWLAGPARPALFARQGIAPFLRERAAATYAITIGLLVLLFIWDPIPATSKPAGIIVFIVLALFGTWLLIRQTAEEFPEARSGAATQAVRARIASIRRGGDRSPNGAPPPPAPATIPQQLIQLAELRDHGAITPDEYQTAKAQLLHG
jgi:Short C-terminal domain